MCTYVCLLQEDRLEELRQQRLGIETRLNKAQHSQSHDIHVHVCNTVKHVMYTVSDEDCVCVCVCVSAAQVGERGDSLDEYMSVVSSQLDPATVTQLRQQVQELRKVSD